MIKSYEWYIPNIKNRVSNAKNVFNLAVVKKSKRRYLLAVTLKHVNLHGVKYAEMSSTV